MYGILLYFIMQKAMATKSSGESPREKKLRLKALNGLQALERALGGVDPGDLPDELQRQFDWESMYDVFDVMHMLECPYDDSEYDELNEAHSQLSGPEFLKGFPNLDYVAFQQGMKDLDEYVSLMCDKTAGYDV
jgi:hypothetical protein